MSITSPSGPYMSIGQAFLRMSDKWGVGSRLACTCLSRQREAFAAPDRLLRYNAALFLWHPRERDERIFCNLPQGAGKPVGRRADHPGRRAGP
ncbi:hypothetical protein AERO9A_320250 [Aeromonas salmonicida]|nr:hypothetical protein AERO9A_320250 [Aeromonas salmonicida]